MVRIGAVVMTVKDARRASQFWSQALGYAYRDGAYRDDSTPVLLPPVGGSPGGAGGAGGAGVPALGVPALAFDETDTTHLDLYAESAMEQRTEVERLISLGATPVDWTYPEGARFVVLADPEGNLFCVINTGRE